MWSLFYGRDQPLAYHLEPGNRVVRMNQKMLIQLPSRARVQSSWSIRDIHSSHRQSGFSSAWSPMEEIWFRNEPPATPQVIVDFTATLLEKRRFNQNDGSNIDRTAWSSTSTTLKSQRLWSTWICYCKCRSLARFSHMNPLNVGDLAGGILFVYGSDWH